MVYHPAKVPSLNLTNVSRSDHDIRQSDTTDNSDWATNCPEYKVTAVQCEKVAQPSAWQERHWAQHKKQWGLLNITDLKNKEQADPVMK